MLGTTAFQAALAAGAPWGAAAWGGATSGVLPADQRVASAVAVPVYGLLAAFAAGKIGSPTLQRRVLRVASVVIGAGAVLNLASPSLVERIIWVPVTVAASWALWRSAPNRPAALPASNPATA
ncbi:hypothetical protein CCO02nite_05610 [Cellulomonas composti]|uniref:Uncharacterized protein n=2 Tax=Cellulomonas composti TaxID=266130 RepID=A0A511J870_9CELL|nr:hypothetical protein CCO02nite_05610 [Cellulomonas composti]